MLKFLEERGCYVERNVQFKRFTEEKNKIKTEVVMPDGSGQIIVSKYIIGADGSKRAVRNFLNIPFKGKIYPRPIYILDCGAISKISSGAITFSFSRKSVTAFFPLRNQRWWVDGRFPGIVSKTKTITLETVAKGLPHWDNRNLKLQDIEWFSVSHSQQKYARTMRIGNCYLAGDSARVNTPVGAQGMNTGLQGAHNLAWKLAYVLKEKAKPELLGSYSTERLGISKGFARYADVVFRVVTNTNIAVQLFRTFVLKYYFKRIFPKLENKEKWRLNFFKSISQIDIHYKPAFETYKELDELFARGIPKPGYRLPYVDFFYDNKYTNSHQILNATRFTLLVFAEESTPQIESISEKYKLATVLLKHLPETGKIYTILGITNSGYYLVRPDMYIALRSATSDGSHLSQYLGHIFISDQSDEFLPRSDIVINLKN